MDKIARRRNLNGDDGRNAEFIIVLVVCSIRTMWAAVLFFSHVFEIVVVDELSNKTRKSENQARAHLSWQGLSMEMVTSDSRGRGTLLH